MGLRDPHLENLLTGGRCVGGGGGGRGGVGMGSTVETTPSVSHYINGVKSHNQQNSH